MAGAVVRRLLSPRLSLYYSSRGCRACSGGELSVLKAVVLDGVGGLDEMEAALDKLRVHVSPARAAELFDAAGDGGDTRRLLRFLAWSRRRSGGGAAEEDLWWEEPLRRAVRCFVGKGDAVAMGIMISDFHRRSRPLPPDVFATAAEGLVKLGRPDEAVRLLGLEPAAGRAPAVLATVHALCGGGQAKTAAWVVARCRRELAPEEAAAARRSLLHGWCRGRNAREARKVLEEMKAAGERPGGAAYQALLSCLCERNLKFNTSALVPEALSVAAEMRAAGEVPTAANLNLLLGCLARARRVKEAWRVLQSMRRGEAGRPPPDWVSYYLVSRVMFLTGRHVRGMRVVRQMLEEDGVAPPPGFFRRLVGLLCGLDKAELALDVLAEMRRWQLAAAEAGPAYDLLIGKLCRTGRFEDGRRLWEEAAAAGATLSCSPDLLDPTKTEVFVPAAPAVAAGKSIMAGTVSSKKMMKIKKIKKIKKMTKKK
ncbi:pentatricopeptide repeat (PPR) superfamily protein [Wolffia australiana]